MADNVLKTQVKVADDVIAMISGIAAASVDGVASLGDGVTFKAVPFIGSKNLKKGVTIEKCDNGKEIKVNISMVLKQDSDLKSTCVSIQEKVKEAVESMLDLKVKEVTVRVAKIDDI